MSLRAAFLTVLTVFFVVVYSLGGALLNVVAWLIALGLLALVFLGVFALLRWLFTPVGTSPGSSRLAREPAGREDDRGAMRERDSRPGTSPLREQPTVEMPVPASEQPTEEFAAVRPAPWADRS